MSEDIRVYTWWLPISEIQRSLATDNTIEDKARIIVDLFTQIDRYKAISEAREIHLQSLERINNKYSTLYYLLHILTRKKTEKQLKQEEEIILSQLWTYDMQEAYALCDFVMNNESGKRDYTREELLIVVISDYMKRQWAIWNTYSDFCNMTEKLEEFGEIEKAIFIKQVANKSFSRVRSKRITLVVDRERKTVEALDVDGKVVSSRSQWSWWVPTE